MMLNEKQISFHRHDDNDTLLVNLSGAWQLNAGAPSASSLDHELQSAAQVRTVAFDSGGLLSWDSTLVAFLVQVSEVCRRRQINLDRQGLPAGVCKLLDLAEAVPEKKGARKTEVETTFVQYVGDCAIAAGLSLGEMLKFTGEMTLTVLRLLRMEVQFRLVDLFLLRPLLHRRTCSSALRSQISASVRE
jgi:phospholipid/cholesterol/gamma-HCH transport system permease protein